MLYKLAFIFYQRRPDRRGPLRRDRYQLPPYSGIQKAGTRCGPAVLYKVYIIYYISIGSICKCFNINML